MAGIRSHPISIRAQARRAVDEATAEFWSNDDIDESYELACNEIWSEVTLRSQDLTMRTTTISVVSGTELYSLPDEILRVRRVCRLSTDGVTVETILRPMRSMNDPRGIGSTASLANTGFGYYLEGYQIGFRPKPTSAWTAQLKYTPHHPSPTTGTASAGSATTITFASAADARDDYYNGVLVTVASGTGSGQTRRLTDYVGSTRVATVDAWTTTPDSTSVYATEPLFPDCCMKWALYETVAQMEIKDKSTRQEVLAERKRSREIAIKTLRLRQSQRSRKIAMVDPDNWT